MLWESSRTRKSRRKCSTRQLMRGHLITTRTCQLLRLSKRWRGFRMTDLITFILTKGQTSSSQCFIQQPQETTWLCTKQTSIIKISITRTGSILAARLFTLAAISSQLEGTALKICRISTTRTTPSRWTLSPRSKVQEPFACRRRRRRVSGTVQKPKWLQTWLRTA